MPNKQAKAESQTRLMHKLVSYHPFDINSLDERARLERNKKVSDPNPHTKPRLCRHFWKRLLNALPHANWVCCMYKDFFSRAYVS